MAELDFVENPIKIELTVPQSRPLLRTRKYKGNLMVLLFAVTKNQFQQGQTHLA